MAFEKKAMVLMVVVAFMAALQLSEGVVYKVGDKTGWTILGNYNYSAWSSTKTFRVGDIILFEYNTQFHNVLEVNHTQFQACDVSAPLVTHTTGNDSISITRTGHFYFLCGIPGHCESGQKVDIRVPGPTAMAPNSMAPSPFSSSMPPSADGADGAMSPSMSPSMSPAMSPMTPADSSMTPAGVPSPNDAALPSKGVAGFVALFLSVFAGFVTL